MGLISGILGLLFMTTIREPKSRRNGRILTEEESTFVQNVKTDEQKAEEAKPFSLRSIKEDI